MLQTFQKTDSFDIEKIELNTQSIQIKNIPTIKNQNQSSYISESQSQFEEINQAEENQQDFSGQKLVGQQQVLETDQNENILPQTPFQILEGGQQEDKNNQEGALQLQPKRIKAYKKITKYESDSIDEEEFKDYFQDPIKRKVFDQQKKRQQMKEMQNISGFTLNKFGIHNIKALRQALPQSIEEEQQPAQEGPKNYATVSLCCLSVTNPFRNNIIQFVLVNPWFDRFILFVIGSNCIFLALDKEVAILTANGSTIDFVYLILYTGEMVMKIIAMGFFVREHSYLRDGWNILDFSVVFLGWLSLGLASGSISGIKVVRTLRPLKAIKQIPHMPSLVKTIIKSIPVLVDVLVLFAFCLIFFGTVGTQLLGGHLQSRCTIFNDQGNATILLGDDQIEIICYEQKMCDQQQPEGVNSTCLYYGNPVQGTFGYDNVPMAIMNVFEAITLAGWTAQMYTIRQVENTYLYDIYFLFIVLSGNFIILNLMIAVQASFLDSAFNEEEQQLAEIEDKKQLKLDQKARQAQEEDERALDDSEFQVAPQIEEENDPQNKRSKKPLKQSLCADCEKPKIFDIISNAAYQFISHEYFDKTFIILILMNTICLATDYYNQPDIITTITGYANIIFMVLFTLEMVFKLVGYGFIKYIEDRFNCFDAFIVLMSFVDAFTAGSNPKLKILKAFRTMRIFKIVKKWDALKQLLDTLANSIIPITNLGLLMMMYVFIGALMCKQFFGSMQLICDDGTFSRYSFNTTSQGLLTMFILLTGDSWNDITAQTIYTSGNFIPGAFFIILTVIGNIMLLNLFLGILLRSLSQMGENEEETKNQEEPTQAVQDAQPLPRLANENQQDDLNKNNQDQAQNDQQSSPERNNEDTLSVQPDELNESVHSNLEDQFDLIKKKMQILADKLCAELENTLQDKFDSSKVPSQKQIEAEIKKSKILTVEVKKCVENTELTENQNQPCITSEDSLFLLSPDNVFRVFLLDLFQNAYYDDFMYHMIGFNSVLLALDCPSLDDPFQNNTIDFLFNIISAIFVIECVLKIIANGFYWGKQAYLKDNWNILDLSIVFFSLLTWTLNAVLSEDQVSFIRGFRALRALRPLKIVSKNEKMKAVINALLEAFPALTNILLIFLMFILVFAILGIQLLKGTQGMCNNNDPSIQYMQNCTGNYTVETTDNFGNPNGTMEVEMVWFVPTNAYDNIFQSMLSFFELATTEQWVIPLFAAIDAVGYDQVPVLDNNPSMCCLFVIFIFLLAFLIINLFVSSIIDEFNQQIKIRQGSDKFTDQQKEWVKLQRLLIMNDPKSIPVEPINCFRMICFRIVQSQIFEYFVVIVIGISTIFLCLDYYEISDELTNMLKTSNTFFIVFFVCEGSMKIIAYGFKYYWYINWNKFDFIVVFLSLLVVDESWLEKLGINPSTLRIIRVMRLFRLIKVSDSLRSLLKTIIIAMANIFTTALLLLLLLFTFSIVGMSLFGSQPDGDNYDDNANFKTFYNSMFLLFRCSTGESWNSVMHDTFEAQGIVGIIYWIAFVFACSFIFLQVFIAVIGESFNDSQQIESENDILALKKKDIKAFKYTWAKYNPEGELFMKTLRLADFLRELPPPLGYLGIRIEDIKLNKIIFCLNIRDHEGHVYYPEVMWSVFHSIAGMNDDNVLNCEQVKSVVKQVKQKYKALGKKVTLESLCGNKYARNDITAIKYIMAMKILNNLRKKKEMREQKIQEEELIAEKLKQKK